MCVWGGGHVFGSFTTVRVSSLHRSSAPPPGTKTSYNSISKDPRFCLSREASRDPHPGWEVPAAVLEWLPLCRSPARYILNKCISYMSPCCVVVFRKFKRPWFLYCDDVALRGQATNLLGAFFQRPLRFAKSNKPTGCSIMHTPRGAEGLQISSCLLCVAVKILIE